MSMQIVAFDRECQTAELEGLRPSKSDLEDSVSKPAGDGGVAGL